MTDAQVGNAVPAASTTLPSTTKASATTASQSVTAIATPTTVPVATAASTPTQNPPSTLISSPQAITKLPTTATPANSKKSFPLHPTSAGKPVAIAPARPKASPTATSPSASTPGKPLPAPSAKPGAASSMPDDDSIRAYLAVRNKDDSPGNGYTKERIASLQETAWHRIPKTIQQAFDSLEMVYFPRVDITPSLSTLNLKSHTILRVDVQRKILAVKLVQRELSLLSVIECKKEVDKKSPELVTDQHRKIRSLPSTSVWRNPSFRRDSSNTDIPWTSGDIPKFDEHGEVIPGLPPLPPPGTVPPNPERTPRKPNKPRATKREPKRPKRELSASRQSDVLMLPSPKQPNTTSATQGQSPKMSDGVFDHSEYCRLLHVLCDSRMAKALEAISRPPGEYDPWEEDIAPMFNDALFAPTPVRKYPGGVKMSDIAGLSPQFCRRKRSATLLREKFSEFKELYISAARSYVRCKREMVSFADFSQGRAFITYGFCLLEIYSDLEPMILRNSKTEGPATKKRRTTNEAHAGPATPKSSHRRSTAAGNGNKAATPQVRDVGNADGHQVNAAHAGLNDRDERMQSLRSSVVESDKANFEAEEARVRMVTAILVAIREARSFANEAKTDDERTMTNDLVQQLKTNLMEQVNVQSYPR